jgi:hypothetical protein
VAMLFLGVRSAMSEYAAGAVAAMDSPSRARPTNSSSYECAVPITTVTVDHAIHVPTVSHRRSCNPAPRPQTGAQR